MIVSIRKWFFSVFLIVLIGVCLYGSSVRAYTWDDFVLYSSQLSSTGISGHNKTGASRVSNSSDAMYNKIRQLGVEPDAYSNFLAYVATNQNNKIILWVWNYNSNGNITINSSNVINCTGLSGYRLELTNNLQYSSLSGSITSVYTSGYDWQNIWGLQRRDVADYRSTYLENKYVPPPPPITFEFTPSYNNYIDVNDVDFLLKNTSRSVQYWYIGKISGIKDFDLVEVNLATYIDERTTDNVATSTYRYPNKVKNGSIININQLNDNTAEINLNQSRILYGQGYNLNFYLREKGQSSGEWFDTSYNFYFLPMGDNSTSGELVSPDLDSNIDIAFLNQFDDYFSDVNEEDVSNTFNNILNFNVSGEAIIGGLDLSKYEPSGDYWENISVVSIWKNIITNLSDDSSETLTFTIHGTNYSFNSADFRTPDGPFRTFVSLLLSSGLIILFYQQLHKMLINFKTLNVSGLVNNMDVDHSIFM